MADMTAEQYGPTERIVRRCDACKACVSESYKCQSDSGHDVYCAHPSLPERKFIGDTTWSTPEWCPVLAARLSGMAAVKEKEAAEYRANFPEQFWDANELLHDYMAYANAPDSGFADESMRLHKLNERAKAMGLTPPKPEGSVT